MKKYDVFKADGGYAVALGVYLDCPVMGQRMWYQTKEEAYDYAKRKQEYDLAKEIFLDRVQYLSEEELDFIKAPTEEDFGIKKGCII